MTAPGAYVLLLCFVCFGPEPVSALEEIAAQVRSLYERGDYAESIRLAETATEPTPDLIFYHGLALSRLERFEEAHATFQIGRLRYPQDKRFPIDLAGVAYRRKHIPAAKSYLRQALRLDPLDSYVNDFLGSLYLLEGNTAAALKFWNRIDKPLIQDVVLAPPPEIHPVLRERAITISGGQVFTLSRLRTTETNLDRLAIFPWRRFELAPRQDQRFDLTLRLGSRSPLLHGWYWQLLSIARGLPYRAIHFDLSNLAHRSINFTSLWRWDPSKRRIGVELAGAIRLNPQYRYRLVLDARDEIWDVSRTYRGPGEELDGLKARKVESGGDLVIAIHEKAEWTTGLRIARRRFQNNNDDSVFTGGWSFEQRNQFTYRWLDFPERRIHGDSMVTLRTGRFSTAESSRFAILEGDLSCAWAPGAKGDTWQVKARARTGTTFGAAPFDEYFQLGMERDNELWLRGHAGTRNGRKGNAPLGASYMLLQAEFDRTILQFPFVRWKAGPFFDAGWIAGPSNRFGSHGWLPDTGVQTKVIVAGGVTWSVVYGRDLRGGRGVFYTAVSR